MAQDFTKVSDILKLNYLPAWRNQLSTEPSPFLEMIKKVELSGNGGGKITAAAPYGINGGFGFGEDGSTTPKSGGQLYKAFELASKDMYVNVEISDKTIKLASSKGDAIIDALDSEIKSAYATAKWNVGRSLFGDGSGKLAKITSGDTNGTGESSFTVDDTSCLIEGLIVDIYTYAGATSTDGTLADGHSGLRITRIERSTKTVYVNSASVAITQQLTADSSYGFITVQNSYNKEICGLGAIYDNNVTSLYGVTKSANPWIKPISVSAGHDLTDIVIYDAVKQAQRGRNCNIDLLMLGDDAFKAFQSYMSEANVSVVEKRHFKGGATGYNILVGNQDVTVVNEQFVPSAKGWGVCTKDFKLHTTDWNFASYESNIFTLISNSSIYRALLVSYGNLICENPGGCIELTECNAA